MYVTGFERGVRPIGILIDQHDIVQPLGARELPEKAGGIAALRLAQRVRNGAIEHLVHQRRLARTGDAGDADQHAQRNLDIHAAQVVNRVRRGERAFRGPARVAAWVPES